MIDKLLYVFRSENNQLEAMKREIGRAMGGVEEEEEWKLKRGLILN